MPAARGRTRGRRPDQSRRAAMGMQERPYAEAKGWTWAIGLDVDTLYGQLLRRMKDPASGARYAVVVPIAARGVPGRGPRTAVTLSALV